MNKLRCITGALTLGCTASALAQVKKPMNIIYIMSDDHSYQTISAYDNRFVEAPNIDWLANHGARFTNSFVANSLSGPSRACMLTESIVIRTGLPTTPKPSTARSRRFQSCFRRPAIRLP